jgi:putative membrane protein
MTMKSYCTQLVLLGALAAWGSPAAFSQMNTMPQSTNPQQPGTMPNPSQPGGQAGAGMAGAMGGAPMTDEGQSMKDQMFLRKAAQGGMAEVQLGQLATQKSGSDEVKQFGQKMVDDHTMLNNDMKPIADSMGIALPKKLSKEDQAEYDKLKALGGDEFDKEYLGFMVKDHHEDLHEFRVENASVQNPTLKAAVEKGQRVIREHTRMVEKLAQSKGVPVPPRGGPMAPPPSE